MSTRHAEYLEHLRSHPEDLGRLYEDLIGGVTRFFRDPETFAALQASTFPDIMKGRTADAPIRVWVAGCSSGEAAYSIAIALLEFLEATDAVGTPIHVFATDLSEAAIAQATDRQAMHIAQVLKMALDHRPPRPRPELAYMPDVEHAPEAAHA